MGYDWILTYPKLHTLSLKILRNISKWKKQFVDTRKEYYDDSQGQKKRRQRMQGVNGLDLNAYRCLNSY